jgi:glycosyltransferase involved in cell wall biosynthesis
MNDVASLKIGVTVVMPALNEEENIADAINNTLEAFNALGIDGEIVAVNDGSSDATQSIMEKKALGSSGRIRIIKHAKPQGIGASFWQGVDESRGSIVVMFPGDNENDPKETLRYVGLLEHVDIVIPFIFNRYARSLFRSVLSFLYRLIINTTFFVNFNYTNGTVLYRRSILKDLDSRSEGFFYQTDILVRAVRKGYLFAEVPCKLGVRNSGISKAVSFSSLLKVTKGYMRLVRDLYFSRNKVQTGFSSDSQTLARRGDPI